MFIDKPFVEWTDVEREENLRKQFESFLEAHKYFNAFITLRSMEEVEGEFLKAGGPLKGLLVPVKDNIVTKGILTTCGSRILSNFVPIYDAFVIEILKSNGAVVVGKTNMDEFAMGNTGETSYYGRTLNPWSEDRVPGGSSSGSAVAVAWKGMVALGSDTGGSVRQPASYNYVVGLKPTYGLISRFGLISYADSLEQIGIFSRYGRDLAYLLYLLSQYDARDMTMVEGWERESLRIELLNLAFHGIDEKKLELRVAYPINLVEKADVEVQELFYKSIDVLRNMGVKVGEVRADFLNVALSTYYIIAMVEASSNLARYSGVGYGLRLESPTYWDAVAKSRTLGFGDEVKRRIIMGTFASSKGYEGKYYIRALRLRRLIKEGLLKLLKDHDCIIMPTTPTPPPKFGEALGPKGYIHDMYTVIPNLTGNPAISIPIGFVNGLPIGLQVVGRYFSEDVLINLEMSLEHKVYNPRLTPRRGGS